jgi:hypothetical protein
LHGGRMNTLVGVYDQEFSGRDLDAPEPRWAGIRVVGERSAKWFNIEVDEQSIEVYEITREVGCVLRFCVVVVRPGLVDEQEVPGEVAAGAARVVMRLEAEHGYRCVGAPVMVDRRGRVL